MHLWPHGINMRLFKKVLCAVDFDQNSILALRAASELARERKADLVLLHVIEIGTSPEVLPFAKMEAAARSKLDRLARGKLPKGARYEIQIRMGDPTKQILGTCRKMSADLIVMATHGRKGLRRLVLGSVAESILRAASCPVLTVRAPSAVRGRSKLARLERRLLDGSLSL